MKKLIAGNWKMNGSRDGARSLVADIVNGLDSDEKILGRADIVLCPPALYIRDVRHALYGFPAVGVGAQDVSFYEDGAYTGDLSARMLEEAGCSHVIVGHSERRQYHGETDDLVAGKARRVLAQNMVPIICVGESEAERQEGLAEAVVGRQVELSLPALEASDTVVIAYEPVWAIGTGKTATPDDVTDMHAFIRERVGPQVRILYGGSMKPENARELLACPNVDGGLIGGASLDAKSFLAIAKAA